MNSSYKETRQKKKKKRKRKYANIKLQKKDKNEICSLKNFSYDQPCRSSGPTKDQSDVKSYGIEKILFKDLKKKHFGRKTILPMNIKNDLNSIVKNNSLKKHKDEQLEMSNKSFNSEVPNLQKREEKYELFTNKKSFSLLKRGTLGENRSKSRSRSESQTRSIVHYCNSMKNRLSRRRFIYNNKYNYKKDIIEKKISTSYPKSKSPEINIVPAPMQLNDNRYMDILREVKKILKSDNISKRNLKYILRKKGHVFIPTVKLQSASADKCCLLNSKRIDECDDTSTNDDNLTELKNNLTIKTHTNIHTTCTLPETSVVDNINKNDLFDQELLSFTSNANEQSIIKSRSPSPALPLIRDEAMLNNNITEAVCHLSSSKPINTPKILSSIDIKSYKNIKDEEDFSKFLESKVNPSNTPKLFQDASPTNVLINHATQTLFNKSHIITKNSFSSHQVPCDSESKPHSESLTPLKLSSTSKHWSPIFLLENSNSNILLKDTVTNLKSNEESFTNLMQISSSQISYTSEALRSKTPFIHYTENFPTSCRTRSRSISNSKYSRSISRSRSRSDQKRSCSKGSTHTFISSTRCKSYSCSSRSRSSASDVTSRPVSSNYSRSRSPSIPRRHGSPSFLDRRRITSARKRPVPYHRQTPTPLSSPSSVESSNYSNWSTQSDRSRRTPSCNSPYLIN